MAEIIFRQGVPRHPAIAAIKTVDQSFAGSKTHQAAIASLQGPASTYVKQLTSTLDYARQDQVVPPKPQSVTTQPPLSSIKANANHDQRGRFSAGGIGHLNKLKDRYARIGREQGWDHPDTLAAEKEMLATQHKFGVVKDNPNHDERGRFSTGGQSGVQSTALTSVDDWKKVGGQGGSNPGGIFESPQGDKWYIKTPSFKGTPQPAVAKNEALANALYKLAGIQVPDMQLVNLKGNLSVASKIIPGKELGKLGPAERADAIAKARPGFAADAWLGGYDAVGYSEDNMLYTNDEQLYRIDQGGTLTRRAQGKQRDFGPKVDYFDSLRDPNHPTHQSDMDVHLANMTTGVFGDMTMQQLADSARHITSIPATAIAEAVHKYDPGDMPADQLISTLIARQKDIASRTERLSVSKDAAFDESKHPRDKDGKFTAGMAAAAMAAIETAMKTPAYKPGIKALGTWKLQYETATQYQVYGDGGIDVYDKSHYSAEINNNIDGSKDVTIYALGGGTPTKLNTTDATHSGPKAHEAAISSVQSTANQTAVSSLSGEPGKGAEIEPAKSIEAPLKAATPEQTLDLYKKKNELAEEIGYTNAAFKLGLIAAVTDGKKTIVMSDGSEADLAARQSMGIADDEMKHANPKFGVIDSAGLFHSNLAWSDASNAFEASMKKGDYIDYNDNSSSAYDYVKEHGTDDLKPALTNGYAVYTGDEGESASSTLMHNKVNQAGFTSAEHDAMKNGWVDVDDNFYSQSSIHDAQYEVQNDQDEEDSNNSDDDNYGENYSSVATMDGRLSSESRDALNNYTGAGYGPINQHMKFVYYNGQKGKESKEYEGQIAAIREAMTHSTLDSDTTLTRGTGGYRGWQDIVDKVKEKGGDSIVGTTIIKPSFQSFTKREDTSDNFKSGVLLHVNFPAGTHAIDINDHDLGINDEHEVLFPYGAYKVTAARMKGSTLDIEADFRDTGVNLPAIKPVDVSQLKLPLDEPEQPSGGKHEMSYTPIQYEPEKPKRRRAPNIHEYMTKMAIKSVSKQPSRFDEDWSDWANPISKNDIYSLAALKF